MQRVWKESDIIAQTHADVVRVCRLGVRSFPVLLLKHSDRLIEVSGGYATAARLARQLLQTPMMTA